MGKDSNAQRRKEKHRQAKHIFNEALESSNLLGFCGSDYALPPGTSVEKEEGYEVLHVHPPRVTPEFEALKAKLPSIKIAELDELAQQCFRGVERLNTIQSVVYETVTRSDENLLVCAPTGSGKTNIALLCILREVREAYNRYEFKVVYIAPLRALSSEITSKFKNQLNGLGLNVLIVTGEKTPLPNEIEEAQVLVVTPEKWDILTRRYSAWRFVNNVRLMVFDEVHMLQTERGPVLEAIIVRALNENQGGKPVRIVGLSATLPNYHDVARFLHVDEQKGLFYFDQRFRAVPLTQSFIGITKEMSIKEEKVEMDQMCYRQCVNCVREGQQVIVFLHSRTGTMKLCQCFENLATSQQQMHLFQPGVEVVKTPMYQKMRSDMDKAQNRELRRCLPIGFGFHNAGVSRRDRDLVERAFRAGYIRVLVSTATLAWGINLPAHTVIIRGTEVYDRKSGCFEDMDVLDVQQIFGRAGRPQFDSSGHGILIGTSWRVQKYVEHLTSRTPIESRLPSRLNDLLCAEVIRGKVTTVHRAIDWLRQTYFFIRYPTKNKSEEVVRTELMQMCFKAAQSLADARMIKFDATGEGMSLEGDTLGRIAYHYYLSLDTIRRLTSTDGLVRLDEKLTVAAALALISKADDFEFISLREEERRAVQDLYNGLPHKEPMAEGMFSDEGKVNCLLQCYISRQWLDETSLATEMNCLSDSASRVAGAFYEIVHDYLGAAEATQVALSVAKAIKLRQWPNSSPLWTMISKSTSDNQLITRQQVEEYEGWTIDELLNKKVPQHKKNRPAYYKFRRVVLALPRVQVTARVFKVSGRREPSELSVVVRPEFFWDEVVHREGCRFTVFVEDVVNDSVVVWHEIHFCKLSPQEIRRHVFDEPAYVRKNYRVRLVPDHFMMPDVVAKFEEDEVAGR